MDSTDDLGEASLPLTAGSRLRAAREAAGLSRSDIASRTKIAERHLLAIEEDRFGDLAARTYAVGFARAYARALGMDEGEIANVVRHQLDADDTDRPEFTQSFEPGDPARIPPVRLAWLAAGGAIVVIVLLLMFWSSFLSPEGKLPDLLPEKTAAPIAVAPSASLSPRQGPAAEGPVVLTATDDHVWLSISDATGKRLLEKEMAKGESWTVPAGIQGAKLRTGRPDALQLSVGGKAVPPLASHPQTVSNVSLAAADLMARTNVAAPSQGVAAQPANVPPAASVQSVAPAPAPLPAARGTPSAAPSASAVQGSRRPAVTPQAARPAPVPTATEPVRTAPTSAANAAEPPAPKPVPTVSTVSN